MILTKIYYKYILSIIVPILQVRFMEVVGQPIPFPGDFLQLMRWFSRAFPGQLLGIIPPVCPGSARGLFTVGRSRDIPKGRLYVELLPDQREILILSP